MDLDTPLVKLSGVGPKLSQKLSDFGLNTIKDLLFHMPTRYQDRTRLTPIHHVFHGNYVGVQGRIVSVEMRFGGKRSLVATISDDTGSLKLRWFHFNKSQQNNLQPGLTLRGFGEAKRLGKDLYLIHPDYELLESETEENLEKQLTPIYPTTEGISQKLLRKLVNQSLKCLHENNLLLDFIPESIITDLALPTLQEAISYVHHPDAETGVNRCFQRLAFEELLAHHLSLRVFKQQLEADPAVKCAEHSDLAQKFVSLLPFQFTQAQHRAIQEISRDLAHDRVMVRLLQGDVGCGKTVVAAHAAIQTIAAGYQVALMAPTEILATQHFQNLSKWFATLNISVALLLGKTPEKEKKKIYHALQNNDLSLVIGTHSLLQSSVQFAQLGLIIVDEQHRFGVEQRALLTEKSDAAYKPHQLIMTATPIPRTLTLSLYADLAHSVINELPPGRKPIATIVLANTRRDEVIARIKELTFQKRQIYWVCPLIEESEQMSGQAAILAADQLKKELKQARIGLIHGRLSDREKNSIMADFANGEIDILVATTVIEVGVDIANATLMVIENAERMGLAQLHQLRGRVGRGSQESYCVLLYQPPLSPIAKERLQVMRTSYDGFSIAEHDLRLRGPGEILGNRQSGAVNFRVADLSRDLNLLPKVQKTAESLISLHPEWVQPLIDRWI